MTQDKGEKDREVRALHKKAKRLRMLAKHVDDAHAVKQMSRDLDAKATELTRKRNDE